MRLSLGKENFRKIQKEIDFLFFSFQFFLQSRPSAP